MTTKTKEQRAADRLKRAQELADQLKRGDRSIGDNAPHGLNSFPPRPLIKKDREAMAKLYGDDKD